MGIPKKCYFIFFFFFLAINLYLELAFSSVVKFWVNGPVHGFYRLSLALKPSSIRSLSQSCISGSGGLLSTTASVKMGGCLALTIHHQTIRHFTSTFHFLSGQQYLTTLQYAQSHWISDHEATLYSQRLC